MATSVMQTRRCGSSDLALPILGVGCWPFGGGQYWGNQDQSDVNAVVRRAVDLGVNFFDTAEVYNDGRSETALGIALDGIPRDRVMIGSKVSPSNVQPEVLPQRCEASLKRLGADYIDLYMVHWPITRPSIYHFNPELKVCPSVEDAFAALIRLRDQGKIRHIGVSNFSSGKLAEALSFCPGIVVDELPYSLLSRAIEWEMVPFCRQRGVGILGYVALQQGLLADIYPTLDDVPVWQRRSRHFDCRKSLEARHGENGAEAETEAALAAIRAIGLELGLTMPQVATKWATANPAVTCSRAGSRTVAELEDNIRSVCEPLPAAIVERLNEATRPLMERLGRSFDYYESAANDRTR